VDGWAGEPPVGRVSVSEDTTPSSERTHSATKSGLACDDDGQRSEQISCDVDIRQIHGHQSRDDDRITICKAPLIKQAVMNLYTFDGNSIMNLI